MDMLVFSDNDIIILSRVYKKSIILCENTTGSVLILTENILRM